MAQQIVSTKLLTKIRKLNLRVMPDTATVLRRGTATADGYGGQTATYSTSNTYQCRFRALSQHERQQVLGEQPMTDPLFVAVLPHDANVVETDWLRINSIDYEIVGWLGNRTYKVGTRIALKEVQPETVRSNT